MPVIDVYAPEDLVPAARERELAVELMDAALKADGFPPPVPDAIRDVVGVFFHRLPPSAVDTGNTERARVVRLQVTAAEGGFDRAGAEAFIAEATAAVASATGDPSQAERTRIYVTQAMKGGLGLNGVVRGLGTRESGGRR
ncbi:hypothetical protein [Amycolatopsis sp. NPDC051903]|uniref:hypothetical protein n=1 Tax=Amycolatopsis sp. NPDC051903 TaxID=3363936 RepID=UPI00378F3A8D